MLGVSDCAEPEAHSRLRAPRYCLPLAHRRRRSGRTVFAAQCPAYVSPYRLLVCPLAETSARLGAGVVRYTFIVEDFHLLLLTSLLANLGVLLRRSVVQALFGAGSGGGILAITAFNSILTVCTTL